jgi:diguanylate cyclase (GGDEF)-like protein
MTMDKNANMRSNKARLQLELQGLRDMLDVARAVVSTLDLDAVLHTILHSAMDLVQTPAGSIALYDGELCQMRLHAHSGLSPRFVAKASWRVKAGGLTRRILDEGKLFIVEDTDAAPFFNNPLAVEEGIRSLIAIPLQVKEKTVGILYVNDFAPRRFAEERLRLLPILASFAAMSIDNARLHERMRSLACTDGLTGLYNHRQFKQMFKEEIGRSIRYRKSLALIMLDIDDFKKFNDRYGHPAGDHVLVTVANLLRKSLRDCDLAYRYGGEEFIIILPETAFDEALKAAERVRDVIDRHSGRGLPAGTPGVTVSMGVACYPRDGQDGDSLLQIVDDLLYRAKGEGKNRVHHLPG